MRTPKTKLTKKELNKMDAYFRALNYLSVAQLYLLDNPLLRKPLKRKDIKLALLSHINSQTLVRGMRLLTFMC